MINLGAEIRAALPGMRRQAESMMTTKVVITRRDGDMTDPVTGEAPTVQVYPRPEWPEDHPHADGKAKLTSYEAHESSSLSAIRVITTQRMTLHVPVGAYEAQVGDVAEVVGSTDELLIGRRVRVTQQAPYKEHATAYRCFVDEVTR